MTWRDRIARLRHQADATSATAGHPSTVLSIALRLYTSRDMRRAATVAERAGVSVAALAAAHRMLTTPPEDQEREQTQVAAVIAGVMSVSVEVVEQRVAHRIVDHDPDERRVRAWRAGWAGAVLLREAWRDFPEGSDERAAAREGADAFEARFAAFNSKKRAPAVQAA